MFWKDYFQHVGSFEHNSKYDFWKIESLVFKMMEVKSNVHVLQLCVRRRCLFLAHVMAMPAMSKWMKMIEMMIIRYN